jgi:CheY-like chemotaxis protein
LVIQCPEPPRHLGERKPPKSPDAPSVDADRLRTASGARMNVLLVDDVVDARDMYALYFKHVGVKVATANDGRSALAAARSDRPDIIVLDLAMPGVTGWDVLRELKGDPRTRDIPVLVLSGQRAQEGALRAGADAYCEKPCMPDKLFGELMRVLYGGQ